jgi:hypothetical protein
LAQRPSLVIETPRNRITLFSMSFEIVSDIPGTDLGIECVSGERGMVPILPPDVYMASSSGFLFCNMFLTRLASRI